MSTTLHYASTVCGCRTAHSQHCFLATVEARELNIKYARPTGKLNTVYFALAAEYIMTRPPMPMTYIMVNYFTSCNKLVVPIPPVHYICLFVFCLLPSMKSWHCICGWINRGSLVIACRIKGNLDEKVLLSSGSQKNRKDFAIFSHKSLVWPTMKKEFQLPKAWIFFFSNEVYFVIIIQPKYKKWEQSPTSSIHKSLITLIFNQWNTCTEVNTMEYVTSRSCAAASDSFCLREHVAGNGRPGQLPASLY